jgi:poly(3-hydroxybutyrate) depolymerase
MRFIHLCTLFALILLFPIISRAEVRQDFLELIKRPRVPLATIMSTMPSAGDTEDFHFSYASDAEQRVPGILLESKTLSPGRHPVVIALHGTGGSKLDELPLLRILASKGFIAVAIDGRYHGERTAAGKGTEEYEAAIIRAYSKQKEHPFFYDSVRDVMRLIDYLQTRNDVDSARIGLYGVSKGGIETYLTAAVDPRVAVAVPCISLESFKWAEENNSWQSRIGTIQNAFDACAKQAGIASPGSEFVHQFYKRVAPKIDSEFDGPSMAPLIAPRALMAINGDMDPRTPMPGLQLCIDAAKPLYHAAGCDDHFLVRIEPNTGHKVTPDSQAAAVDWFVKWLKPKPN